MGVLGLLPDAVSGTSTPNWVMEPDRIFTPKGPILLRPGQVDPGNVRGIDRGAPTGAPTGAPDPEVPIWQRFADLEGKTRGVIGGLKGKQKTYFDQLGKAKKAAVDLAQTEGEIQQSQLELDRANAEKEAVLGEELRKADERAIGKTKEKQAGLAEAIRQYRESRPVDANRVWKDDSGNRNVAKILGAALASGMGAYASAMTGAPNYALQIINEAIARDIEEQRSELDRAKGGVDLAGLELGVARQVYDDDHQQRLAAHNMKLGEIRQAIEIKKSELKSPLMQRGLDKLGADMDAQMAKTDLDLSGQTAQLELGAQRDALQGDLMKAQAIAKSEADRLAAAQGQVPGVVSRIPLTEAQASKIRERMAVYEAFKKSLDNAQGYAQKGGRDWSDLGKGRGGQLSEMILSEMEKMGVDRKAAEGFVPKAGKLNWGGDLKSTFDNLRQLARDKTAAEVGAYNGILLDDLQNQQSEALKTQPGVRKLGGS